jgi:hypothetical protein
MTIAVQFVEFGENPLDVIETVRALGVARHLDDIPGTEIGIDFFSKAGAFFPQVVYLRAEIDIGVGAHQLQFLNLHLKFGDGLFEVQEVGIHAGNSPAALMWRTVYKNSPRQTNSRLVWLSVPRKLYSLIPASHSERKW